jgi:hypothetical protein
MAQLSSRPSQLWVTIGWVRTGPKLDISVSLDHENGADIEEAMVGTKWCTWWIGHCV